MTETIIGAVVALAGVLVGIVAETWRSRLSFNREKAWVLFEQQRARLEQIYEALSELSEIYANAYIEAVYALNTDPVLFTVSHPKKSLGRASKCS